MVRSMMSQTTLSKSFWDLTLEVMLQALPLHVWGCEALVKRDTLTKPDKLEPRSFKCIFVGYPKETMGYSFYNPFENKVFVSRNAKFFESNLIDQEASGSEEHELGIPVNPATTKAALLDLESKKWLAAMNVEMQSMKDNDVWELVELPPNAKTIGHKWLFKKKTDMEDIRAIRILIAIVAFYDYEIWQMDVKTAFLNGHLSEEVYMTQPKHLRSYLGKCFAMKDLGEAAYILGIKIYRDRSKRLISLCQSAYIEKILKIYYMKNSKRRTIPMQDKLKLSKSDGASTPAEKRHMSNVTYALAVGSIMYAVRCTRPDVAFAQNITSRFQQNPGKLYWTTVKNILKYLQNTKDMFMVYGGDMKQEIRVSCYTDAGYLIDADDLKSQTGYVFVLNRGAVDWKSTKQSISATSSTDAEYIATFYASKEAVWILKFISGLNVVPIIEEPVT
ncbi:retrotransposon protein, putative, ty1-copia subclass, partial [Tanacetum coccineum]